MKLGLHMCESRDGPIIADWTDDAEDVVMTTGDHGFHTLSFFVEMGTHLSFHYYNLPGVPYIGVFHGGEVVWEGRVEDIAIVDGGINVVAFGYWSALSDAPYNALWSHSGSGAWETITDDDISYFLPDRWALDNNNRLYMAPHKDENFGSTSAWGGWGYKRPDRSERYLLEIDYSYEFTAPTNWRFRLRSYADGWTSFTNEFSLTGDGTTQSGSRSDTLAANKTSLMFALYFDTTAADYTGETGDVYLKITNIRVKSVTTSTVTAGPIIADLITFISDLNGELIDDSTSVFDPNVDLDEAVFEDALPADIISALATVGDDSTPPNIFEAMMWEGPSLHFHPMDDYDSVQWHTDAEFVELERSLQSLTNSYYAVFDSGKQRTAVGADADSVAIHSLTRRGFISANTTSETQAETIRDSRLECTCGRPRANIGIVGLYDKRGGDFAYWHARAGDKMTLRNLDPDLGTLDNLRTFLVDTTEHNLSTNELSVTPEEMPSVELIAAQGNI
jgi:hypothetical protein